MVIMASREDVGSAVHKVKTRKEPTSDGSRGDVIKNVCDTIKSEVAGIIL